MWLSIWYDGLSVLWMMVVCVGSVFCMLSMCGCFVCSSVVMCGCFLGYWFLGG